MKTSKPTINMPMIIPTIIPVFDEVATSAGVEETEGVAEMGGAVGVDVDAGVVVTTGEGTAVPVGVGVEGTVGIITALILPSTA